MKTQQVNESTHRTELPVLCKVQLMQGQHGTVQETTQPVTLEIITKIVDADKATHNVSIGVVLSQLKAGLREKIKNHMCSYFSAKMGCYVYLGVFQAEA